MNGQTATSAEAAAMAVHLPVRSMGAKFLAGCRKILVFFCKYFWGMIFCQSMLGGILIVGWTYRLAQRSVLKYWWRQSELRKKGVSFITFLEMSERNRIHARWPNWFVQAKAWNAIQTCYQARSGIWTICRGIGRAAVHSLWLNFKIGTQGIFNTWVLTLPGCILWLFAWYDGWNNSFNKGYEQAAVGPLTGLLGVALFIMAMLYVPMAQARQAATGNWRAFYQVRLVWGLVRRKWLACLGLAMFYSILSIPVSILNITPIFFIQMNPSLSQATDAQIVKILETYFFWSSLFVFPAYVVLRLAAARIYASALLQAVQSGRVTLTSLKAGEQEDLEHLGLSTRREQRRIPVALKPLLWLLRTTVKTATIFIWFTFVSQIFIREFFNYHPQRGWLNQPLVQLPWFQHVPEGLHAPKPAGQGEHRHENTKDNAADKNGH